MANRLDFDGDHGATYVDEIRKAIPGYADLHTMVAAILKDRTPVDGRILVAGCGGGQECVTLGDANGGWRIEGVDPSERMVDIARRRTAGRENVALTRGGVDDLPDEGVFDAATSMLVLHFIRGDEAKRAHLAAIARRMRPGAPLALATVYRPDPSPLNETLEKAWATYVVLNGGDREQVETKMKAIAEEIDPVDEATTMRLLAEAGFPHAQRFYTGFRFAAYLAFKGGRDAGEEGDSPPSPARRY